MKLTTILQILAVFLLSVDIIGCGNSGSGRKQGEIYGECFKDQTCNEGLVCDKENNACIKGGTVADEDMENPDESNCDDDNNTDSSQDEYKNWKDPKTGLIWSEKHYISDLSTVNDLVSFCDNLVEGGYSNWKMPTIDELRTLVQNCSNTEPYGSCKVSEETGALSEDYWDTWKCVCPIKDEWRHKTPEGEWFYDNGGYYSKIGDDQNVTLFSSSGNLYRVWGINFGIAIIETFYCKSEAMIRCVGSYSRQKQCEGLPENAGWNVFSSIPQTWDGSSWQPADTASYNETPSETECRFICNPGYKWDGSKCALQDLKAISKCSHGSPTPCYDSSSGLVWSAKAPYEMLHYDAVDYCDNLVEGGYSDWHLPTISELRTLIQNCRWTVTGGDCRITDDCLSATACEYSYSQCDNDCNSIGGNWGGIYVIYSKFGDEGDFLSSSKVTDSSGAVWGVGFDKAQILIFGTDEVYDKGSVRCVKKVNVPCTGLPENAVWNSVSSILQTCDETSCQPSTVGVYNETPSETECRFKCYPGYEWNGSKCTLKTPEALSECSPESPMPCRDSATGLIWSANLPEKMMFEEAFDYCDNLVEGVIDDWRLPTVGELRTLIVNCPASESGGECGVTDDCLSRDECWILISCKCRSGEAAYSKFYSKSVSEAVSSASKTGKIQSGFETVWCVDFKDARITPCSLEYEQNFRCVR